MALKTKNVIITVLLLVAVGQIYWITGFIRYRIYLSKLSKQSTQYHRPEGAKVDPDDNVFLKNEHPMSLKDEKSLKGRTLWVSAGGQMDYFPFNGHAVDYQHTRGVLLGAEKIIVKDAIEQKAPQSAAFRIPQGDAQVLLIFAKADEKAPAHLYGVPVGDREGKDYNLLTDQIFFYDDPHQLYGYWGPQVWQAIDEHRAILGMSERQTQMALGQVSTPRGDIMGDRNVEFDDLGKPKIITFVNGKSTEIKDLSH